MESNYPQETKLEDTPVTTPVKVEPAGLLTPASTDQPWQEWLDVVFDFLSKIPAQVGSFFADYKQPLVTLLLIVSSLVSVYITLAVLNAIDDIPLLAPILELVGLIYTGWFVYRYLLKASTRAELLAEFEALKSQVVGKNSQNS